MRTFPTRTPGLEYLTEGGQETEIMDRHGFELPEFAVFPLLDDPEAVAVLDDMYRRSLDTAARHGLGVLMGGLDDRASPDRAGQHPHLDVWGGCCGTRDDHLEQIARTVREVRAAG